MILIPIGHEAGDSVRRLPWVTFSVIGLCLAALIATYGVGLSSAADVQLQERAERALEYWVMHPYLELDPHFAELLGMDESGPFTEFAGEAMREGYVPSGAIAETEQAELDRLVEAAMAEVLEHPYSRFGLTPADFGLIALLTHMFMHAGWLHLIGNMLILYLAGPFIEDVWGRAVYGGFYLVGGIVAALSFVAVHPDSQIPLVGASGAVAAVMGAFLVRYWETRIAFFYMVGFFVRGTFMAPAWLMLPLWFLEQLFMAAMLEGVEGGGVAYWAHIGGFAFGAAVAGVIKLKRIEERFLDPAIRRQVEQTVVDNDSVDQALNALELGDGDGAFAVLAEEARRQPTNDDVALAFWHVALEVGRPAEAVPTMLRVVQSELRRGDVEAALEHWAEIAEHVDGSTRLEPGFCMRLARACVDAGRIDDAVELLRRSLLAAGTRLDPSQALQIARLGARHEPDIAGAALRLALARPDLEPDTREQLERASAELAGARG